MNTEQFIKLISKRQNRSLKKEFVWASKNKEVLTPHLLKILKNTVANTKKLSHKDTGHTIAIFLLAQFREKAAFPLIISLLKKMKGSFEERILDGELEYIPNILASTFNGNLKLLFSLIEDKNAYEFARAAALETLIALWDTKQISRKTLIIYFEKLLDQHIKRNDDHDITWWVIYEALKTYPSELIQKIRLSYYFLGEYAYYDDYNYSVICPKEFEDAMRKGKDHVLKKYLKSQKYHFIKNINSEIGDWCCFHPEHDFLKKHISEETAEKLAESKPTQPISTNHTENDNEEYYGVGDEKHMAYCRELFGNFNEKGLLSLQNKYDTRLLNHAKDKLKDLEHDIAALCSHLDLMANAAKEMIDGDSPWQNNYDIEEHGDIGDFANELYETAGDIGFNTPRNVKEILAPLCRLMPIKDINFDEPTEFYKSPDDILDEPKKKQERFSFDIY